MRPTITALLLALTYFMSPLPAEEAPPAGLRYGDAADVQMSAAVLHEGVQLFKDAVDRDEFRGVVLLVARHGTVVLHEAIGWRDLKKKRPMEKDTLFRMASTSKPVTSLGILLLIDAGRIGLDDPIAKHLSAFGTKNCRDITLRHLLTHTSGLRIPTLFLSPLLDLSDEPGGVRLIAEVNRFAEIGPEVTPGTTWNYNNAGYNILAAVIERTTGSYIKHLRDNIYKPLEMVDSCNQESDADLARMSAVFRRQQDATWAIDWQPGDSPAVPFPRGSGGMISTARDYAAFCQMLLQDGRYNGTRIVGEQLVRQATNPQTRFLAASHSYGLGWRVTEENGTFYHGGSDGTWVCVDPSREIIGMVMMQTKHCQHWNKTFQQVVERACTDAHQSMQSVDTP